MQNGFATNRRPETTKAAFGTTNATLSSEPFLKKLAAAMLIGNAQKPV